jgi:hypothetical protein
LDHNGYLPSFAVVTEGKHSEVAVARGLRLEPGTILVIDRGYNDYEWFAEMTRDGVFFVTRMKTSTVYRAEQECEIPAKSNVLRDQIISLPALGKAGEESVLFRRIEYWNEEKREILVFFTNLLHLAAATIAAIYKDRWQVELFFKALKQTTFGWSLSNLAALLRQQLFIFRDLWAWLNAPLEGPPAAHASVSSCRCRSCGRRELDSSQSNPTNKNRWIRTWMPITWTA